MDYQISKTTEMVVLRTTESHDTITPLLPVISLSVIKYVGTSQNGEWMYTLEVVCISLPMKKIQTEVNVQYLILLIFKCGDHHPQWISPLAQATTVW